MTESITVRVRAFAVLREVLGFADIAVQVPPGADVATLLGELARHYPAASLATRRFGIAVNRAYASPKAVLKEGDEVALIPPVSGGAGKLFEITPHPISIDEVAARVTAANRGAITCFAGTVRGITSRTKGPEVGAESTAPWHTDYLDYEAYPEMAESAFAAIAVEVRARWSDISAISIVHRIGKLAVGEVSLVIAVAAAHRRNTFDACHYAIDRIKQVAPIWKREVGPDGTVWVEGPESDVMRDA